jgi:hypothetical protein
MDPNLAELLDDEMEVLKKRLNAYIASIGPRESR